jgi:hypothetical protein
MKKSTENQQNVEPQNNWEKAAAEANQVTDQQNGETSQLRPWIVELEKILGVNAEEILTKQAETAELIPEDDRGNSDTGLNVLAKITMGKFTENELIFMYVVTMHSSMQLSEQIAQAQMLLQFLTAQQPD